MAPGQQLPAGVNGRLAVPVMVVVLIVMVRPRACNRWNGKRGENGDGEQAAH
jgi:hypothetical protein